MPNCSQKLSFRIFADDTNLFYASNNQKELKVTINTELKHVFEYCNVNKQLNLKKLTIC